MALHLLEFSRSRTRGGDGYWIGDINAAFDQDSDIGGHCGQWRSVSGSGPPLRTDGKVLIIPDVM